MREAEPLAGPEATFSTCTPDLWETRHKGGRMEGLMDGFWTVEGRGRLEWER